MGTFSPSCIRRFAISPNEKIRLCALAASASLALTAAAAMLPAQSATADPNAALDALVHRWSTVHDYQVDIDQHEVDGNKTEDHQMHYSLLNSPAAAKVVVTGGADRGMQMIWHGGDHVSVYHGGFLSFAKLSMPITAKMVTSVRGNSILAANPATALDCFAAHRDALQAAAGPVIDGKPTQQLMMQRKTGVTCPDEPAGDSGVTRDVLLISPDTELPVERMRYIGATLVERWRLTNLKLNSGLTASDFK